MRDLEGRKLTCTLGMPVEALLPAWGGNTVDVEVQIPGERSSHAFQGTAVELWIQKGDCELEAKGRCEREGIGHSIWGDDVGIAPSQGAHQWLRASGRSHRNQT